MPDVWLNKEEMELVKDLAEKRANAGFVTPAEAAKVGTYTARQVEEIGIMGEIGVAKFYGVEIDDKIYKERSEGGADITFRGKTANIKSTKYFSKPHLLVPEHDSKYDAYILCSVNADVGLVRIQGYATNSEVKNTPAGSFAGRSKPTRVIEFDKLRPIKYDPDTG